MVMLGCSATFINTSTPKIMGGWFSPSSATAMMGIALASTNVAMALGSGTAALFKSTQSAFVFTAVIAVFVMFLWMVFIKEKKTEAGSVQERAPFKESIAASIKNKGIWASAMCAMAMSTGLTGCGVFMPQALMSRGLSEAGAGAYGMALTFGYMTTSLVSPILIKKIGTTKKRLRVLLLVYGILMTVFSGRPGSRR
jgi:NNP family nitrate/nitrite transporter-like MFS transporter